MGSVAPEEFDFIVVGAGPAGSMVASRLSRSTKRPSVLLIEAGGNNDLREHRVDAERWLHRMNPASAWGYQTVPQKNLDDMVVSYDRGKGLGGSTAINFSVWTVGPKDDYDEIARLVGDDEWKWQNVHEQYKRIESYHGIEPHVPSGFQKYLDPRSEDHGSKGPIDVGFPVVWEKTLRDQMDLWVDYGHNCNIDHNDGDPVGVAVCVNSAFKGIRTTASAALQGVPENLRIMIDAQVGRVIFNDKTAVGIETIDGRSFQARKEVILSTGSLDTPRILMHSGIGDADQLTKFGLPVVHANQYVGQHLKDHCHINPTWERADHTTERHKFYKSKELQAAARAQWETDQTGPLAEIACAMGIGFLKLPSIYETPEFANLPAQVQTHLQQPTVPAYEILLNGPTAEYFMDPDNTPAAATTFIFLLNGQSEGSVTLQSSDPSVPLLFDPNFFSHPYDRRLAVEATREVLKVHNNPAFQKDTVGIMSAPESDSEADILAFWRKTISSTWHMSGTAKMGTGQDKDRAVVDKDFKVFGVERLRVADMSVYPVMVK